MPLKIYSYANCGTCRKALKYLDTKDVTYKLLAIRETPPSKTELKKMLKFVSGDIKKLFNTSGKDYKSMNLKETLADMSEEEKLDLLTSNGNLVKRPFVLGKDFGMVGFKEVEWEKIF